MSKLSIGFTRVFATCLICILTVTAFASVCAFAEENEEISTSNSAGEITEELPRSLFYDAGALIKMKGEGQVAIVQDDLGFNALKMSASGTDPHITLCVPDEVSTDKYQFVAFFVKKPTTATFFQAGFKGEQNEEFTKNNTVQTKYKSNKRWQIIVLELSELDIKGDLEQIRIDYHSSHGGSADEYCLLAGIAFGKTEDDAMRPICDLLGESEQVVYHFSDFSEEESQYLFESYANTTADISNGNIIYRAVGRGDPGANDARSNWNIEKHLEYLGYPPLDARDFGYLVIKYKAHVKDGIKQTFEIFYQIDWRVDAAYGFSVCEDYTATDEWQGLQFNFKDEAIEWAGTVHSLRIDWSDGLPRDTEGAMKISDVYLLKNFEDAAAINGIMKNITVVRVGVDADMTEETTVEYTESPSGSDTISFVPDDEIEEGSTGEVTEETIPVLVETLEESTEEITEGSSGGAEPEKDAVTEPPKQNADEEDTGLIGDDEAQQGSEVPFYIACACLALLSLLSVVTVVVIRARNK